MTTLTLRPYLLAKLNGETKYQGKRCLNGHAGIRYTISGNCIECKSYKPTGKPRNFIKPARAAAIKNGDKFYNTGKPCRAGHMADRTTKGSQCVECKRLNYINKRKPKERAYGLVKYGLTLDQYNEMLQAQNFVCKICEQPETSLLNGKPKPLAVDHCHNTNKIRGLLCSRCNIWIGNLKHNPILLRAAALYCEET